MVIKAYILLKVSSGAEKDVCKRVADLDNVMDASIIYGEYDIIAKVNTQEISQLNELLDKIRSMPSVILTSTMIVAQEYKGRNKREEILGAQSKTEKHEK
ncbi:MAG: Lrp/AsnC ligand binding domain-containing protein [Candidatus Bathyarchaeia archaeon]|nr:Lrp/AsnC ligand binding domain-containing protein [Candidatus Bathyarchaeota archaeon]